MITSKRRVQHELKKKSSNYRRNMQVGLLEGIPATVIYMTLGGPYLTGYLLYLGASSVQVGIAAAIPALTNVLQILAALGMQYINNRRLAIIIFASIHRVVWVLTGLIPFLFPESLWVIIYLIMMFIAFAGNAVSSVAWTSLIADMVPSRLRGKYFGLRNAVINAAGSVSLFVCGMVLDHYGEDIGFAFIYIVCAIAVVLNIILFFAYPNVEFEKSQETDIGKRFLLPFRDWAFIKPALFISAFLFFYGIVVPFFNYLMLDVLEISYSWVSIITIIHYITMILAYYYWGKLNARFSTRQLLMWSLPIIGLSCLAWGLIGLLPAVPVLLFIHILLGIGLGGYNLLNFTFVIGDTPKADRPVYIGVFMALTGLMSFIGSTLGGVVFDWLANWSKEAQVYGVTLTIGAVLVLMMAVWGERIFGARWRLPKKSNPWLGRGA